MGDYATLESPSQGGLGGLTPGENISKKKNTKFAKVILLISFKTWNQIIIL